jgi:oligopeptide/dipeptide ABC transporter ATP-binding protein
MKVSPEETKETTPVLLEIDELRTYIRQRHAVVRAVDGVSFSVDAGETVGIVGESGCGKTMTGMSVISLLPPGGYIAGGSIVFEGRDLTKISDREIRDVRGNQVAVIFQDPMTSLNPTMTIGRQIAEPVERHRGASRSAALARAEEVLALVGMPKPKERLGDYPHQLSGGLRQRAMIAMALACEPRLLIADEPTTALDVTIQKQILELLDDLKARLGMAMILITHDLGVIAGRADKVVVMYAGKIVEQAETLELFEGTRHPYTEALLASIPQVDQRTDQPLYAIPGLPPDLADPPPGCRFAPRCAYASQRCSDEEPRLQGERSDHLFACFHPVGAEAGARLSSRVGPAPVAVAIAAREDREPPPAPPPLLVIEHVSKEFPVTSGAVFQRRVGSIKAVSDVSLSIAEGETLGLVGESGCGKTTLGRLITVLERLSAGRILFAGDDLARLTRRELRARRRDLQLMFQDPYASLDPRMRVSTIMREPLAIQHYGSRAEQERRVEELLGEVGLPAQAAQRYPHEFSGGQRQRIGLARALALNPRLIVADEPVSALDVSVRSQILNLMKRLQAVHNLTYMVISHDLSVVRYLADRIGVMYLGKLVEIGTGSDIYERTAHPYTAGLLKTIPVPDPVLERQKRGATVLGELPSPMNPPSGCRFRTRCERAEEICAVEEPPLVAFGECHEAACHFPLQAPLASAASAVGSR